MKKTQTILVAVALALTLVGPGLAASYTIDTAHSEVIFKVKHLGISTVTGEFQSFSGSFEFDDGKIESSSVSATIDVASIDTSVEKRDDHLRSADFFEVEKYPNMTFKSTKIQSVDGGEFQIVGDLTIKGVTKSVVLDAVLGGTATDPYGTEKAAFTAETKIDRKEFGITWGPVLETGGLVVSNDVRIILEVQGNKTEGK